MTRRFGDILDECIDRIVRQHETVEQCLARYPEHALQLEPELRAVARAVSAYEFTPSGEAKARGRLQLRREMEYLSRAKPRGWRSKLRLPAMTLGAPPRWAMGIAVVLVALGLGSTSVVAASGGAEPGDALYGVKTAVEEVTLALEFSEKDKAELHLKYAERRTDEISKLIERGEEERLLNAQEKLEAHLNEAVAITRKLEKAGIAAEVRLKLEEKARQTLAELSIRIGGDSTNRLAALENLELASESFGQAIELLAESVPMADSNTGTLQIRAAEWDAPGLERLTIQIADLEVFRVDGRNRGWALVGPGVQDVDLVRVEGSQVFLGEAQLVAGSYTKLRFRVTEAIAQVNGNELRPEVPSDRVQISRPFKVEEGETTVIVLEFDPRASLQRKDSGQWYLKPRMRVLVEEPAGDEEKDRDEDDEREDEESEDKEGGSTNRTRSSTTVVTSTQQSVRVEVYGAVESVVNGAVTLRGKSISITGETDVSGEIQEGSQVEIEGIIESDGSFIAQSVKVTQAASTTPQEKPEEQESKVEFTGIVESMAGNMWTVAGMKVEVNRETEIEEKPAVGALVEIKGVRMENGVILAESVEIEKPVSPAGPANRTVIFSAEITSITGQLWMIGDYTVIVRGNALLEGEPQVGATAHVQGVAQRDEVVLAEVIKVMDTAQRPTITVERPQITVPAPTIPQVSRVEVEGEIREMEEETWLVDDQVVNITPETVIVGTPNLGANVRVIGLNEDNGELRALVVLVSSS
jgi:hypothetical protein